MVSSNASLSPSDIAAARLSPEQPLFFQLYKRKDDEQAIARVREIERLGYNAIFLTVDAPIAGNRERDIRAPFELEEQEREAEKGESMGGASGEGGEKPATIEDIEMLEDDADDQGTAGALLKLDDQDMTWERTIPWLRSVTKLPIVLKGQFVISNVGEDDPNICEGIQCVEDAALAAEAGVDGILISNHGGQSHIASVHIPHRLKPRQGRQLD
jgi:L-lactate dehydrogenase (cytochrome)